MTTPDHLSRSSVVAANIRAEISRRRMPQYELARLLGISPASMSSRLTGQTPIDVNELHAIADLLGVQAADLLKDAA